MSDKPGKSEARVAGDESFSSVRALDELFLLHLGAVFLFRFLGKFERDRKMKEARKNWSTHPDLIAMTTSWGSVCR
ncbi:hypothetical protein WN51_10784 [Melipona quadrifasciata]|uniref:Uncharacterized protein n=1 Tax=Melipona quadrifasciata TaxID=166423 RepID=A0A0N0U637_9HYME|nr:hypothetical protein WN51_10784 [Melipona quadrifasciata]